MAIISNQWIDIVVKSSHINIPNLKLFSWLLKIIQIICSAILWFEIIVEWNSASHNLKRCQLVTKKGGCTIKKNCTLHSIQHTKYCSLRTIYELLFCSLNAVNPTCCILHTLFYTLFMNANLFCNLHAVYITYCTLNTTYIILHSIYEL